MTGAALARAARLDPATLLRIESNERPNIRFSTVCRLADALGVSTDEIASRAGLLKKKPTQAAVSAQAMIAIEGFSEVDSLLNQARSRISRIKKRLR